MPRSSAAGTIRWTLRVPPGEGDKLHIWIRIDKRLKRFDDRKGVRYDGLNNLIRNMGGKHMDVIVGNYRKGFHAYGLYFKDMHWREKSNGDGAKLLAGCIPYERVKDKVTRQTKEGQIYMGIVKNKRRTIRSIATLAKAEIIGKVYDHQRYNCETFAKNLASKLKNG